MATGTKWAAWICSLKLAAQDAGIDLSLRPGTIYAGNEINE